MEAHINFVAVDMPTANRLTVHILAALAEEEARANLCPHQSRSSGRQGAWNRAWRSTSR